MRDVNFFSVFDSSLPQSLLLSSIQCFPVKDDCADSDEDEEAAPPGAGLRVASCFALFCCDVPHCFSVFSTF